MNSYNYVQDISDNLYCCICRTPFVEPLTTRTCSHTFCRECIVAALGVSLHCPIDRSPITFDDLTPADPLIRNLVSELEVECPNQTEGCTHTCQRQLMVSHLKETCSYALVPCEDEKCEKIIFRKDCKHVTHSEQKCDLCGSGIPYEDLEGHRKSCEEETMACAECLAEIRRKDVASHSDTCPDVVISCTHAENGCTWKGSRRSLNGSHTASCPYEAIKGFLLIHKQQMSALDNDNQALRHKMGALEGVISTLKHELATVKAVLGPWYHPDRASQHTYTPGTSSSPNEFLHSDGYTTLVDPSDIAYFFPPTEETPGGIDSLLHPASISSSSPPSHQPSFSHPQSIPRWAPPSSQHMSQTQAQSQTTTSPVAPLNLSTTLEGALTGLRESIVMVSSAVDSLARRQEVAQTTESMRMTEEIRSLRAVVHGLRMQVHAVMMDRNAQVTGRLPDSIWPIPSEAPPPWMAVPYPPPRPNASVPPVTKL